jgi:hypothetical protein
LDLATRWPLVLSVAAHHVGTLVGNFVGKLSRGMVIKRTGILWLSEGKAMSHEGAT